MTSRFLPGVILFFCLLTTFAVAAPPAPPGARDKCPVCGMFVAKFPDWTATVVFKDGSVHYCDGVKDLMRLLLEPQRYGSRQGLADVATVLVKDYYSLEAIDATTAFYVHGSDVFGPMGKELIPFARRADAEEFKRDHKGKEILTFAAVTTALLESLD